MSDGLTTSHVPQADDIVRVKNLSEKYDGTVAVNGISFALFKGEVFAS